ncbi:hypothetical protein WN48_07173 [Eufriesea mexicana]|uniref:Uncharacterized protein n=1 Tax=Eufriesea mexicana TaxID=516756 RepID=A0A310SW72_9HYME|nr:hypothetical protein WN48_07173 [Eufriesea mexicana]
MPTCGQLTTGLEGRGLGETGTPRNERAVVISWTGKRVRLDRDGSGHVSRTTYGNTGTGKGFQRNDATGTRATSDDRYRDNKATYVLTEKSSRWSPSKRETVCATKNDDRRFERAKRAKRENEKKKKEEERNKRITKREKGRRMIQEKRIPRSLRIRAVILSRKVQLRLRDALSQELVGDANAPPSTFANETSLFLISLSAAAAARASRQGGSRCERTQTGLMNGKRNVL